jgi:hypothetical protein
MQQVKIFISYVGNNKKILIKKACFHEWKLVKEVKIEFRWYYIYICQKCGEFKIIKL